MADSLGGLLAQGGFVAPFLLVGLLALWYGLGYRLVAVRRGVRGSLRELVRRAAGGDLAGEGLLSRAARVAVVEGRAVYADPDAEHREEALRGRLEVAFAPLRGELDAHASLVEVIVVVAPLAGLLGTVSGMIETFASLAEMALFTQGGGIAGGIGEALVSTQIGLAVAVPGLVIGGLLAARQRRLEGELDELVELLCSRGTSWA